MKLHGQQKNRKERIECIFKFIKIEQPVGFLAVSSKFDGIAHRTLKTYLKILINNNRINTNQYGRFVIE